MVEIKELAEGGELRQRKDKAAAGQEVVDLSGDGKLVKRIVREGEGEVIGDHKHVAVHYTGKFPDGKVFDSSVSRGVPLQFNVGERSVILGWDIGVASMKKGEKAELICHPDYAYGSSGAGGVIPPNATLHFDVELMDVGEASEHGSGWVSKIFFLLLLATTYYVFFVLRAPENT
ncbi:FK506-binding protein 59 (Peptidyl-prolyl cis-trans isomerase) (PPIase) (Rotamase) (dFKBP59) [Durusdinium trenchii]|uniref:peptidylprolyl isomerase n=1 Tax=Durusdinium trenchii TaxID=1381693 RepID=A0ABP0SFE4_9DINO